MKMTKRQALTGIAAGVGGLILQVPSFAQSYPSKPIKIIASAPPGGAYDFVARALADGFQKSLGQPAVVENRGGAGGTIGTEAGAKAQPDGYTLTVGSTGPMSVAPSMISQLRYDPVNDFVPVARLVRMPSYLVVHPSFPAMNVQEFIDIVRKNPGKYSYASTGNGLSQHTNMELLKSMANLFILGVPYRGSGPAITDLLGGQVQMMVELGPQAIPHVKAGKLRVLATTTSTRTEAMPDVPTLDESGVKGFDAFTWFALYAPAGTPVDVVGALRRETIKIFTQPEVKARLAALGAEVALTNGEELAAFQAAERKKWAEVLKRAGIEPQ